jgi:hypothetical protein
VEKPRIGIAKKVLIGTLGVVTRIKRAWAVSVGLIAPDVLYTLLWLGSRFFAYSMTGAAVKVRLLKLYLFAFRIRVARASALVALSGTASFRAEAPASAAASAAFCSSVLAR